MKKNKVGRPRVAEKGRSVTLAMKSELFEKVKNFAEEKELSISSAIRWLVKAGLSKS